MAIVKRKKGSKKLRKGENHNGSSIEKWIFAMSAILCTIISCWIYVGYQLVEMDKHSDRRDDRGKEAVVVMQNVATSGDSSTSTTTRNIQQQQQQQQQHQNCPVSEISTLSDDVLHPRSGKRHMITPPDGGKVILVCCSTTKGNMSILLHHKWAPRGVDHFLTMVSVGYYFTSYVPLFRCTDACQFGLAGLPNITKQFDKRIKDDPPWLPPGPAHRYDKETGVRRYPSGFLTYAGSGQNSRSNQFVLTLTPNQFMGGGSPWEVPLGELVGEQSFTTMSRFYTGYGEKGPSQALIRREGGKSDRIRKEWPLLDYVTGCNIIEEKIL